MSTARLAAVPTSAEEDAKRPHREREALVGEQTTIINRIKGTLARLGIRNFNPKLWKAPERIESVRTPEGEPIPPKSSLAQLGAADTQTTLPCHTTQTRPAAL